MRGDNRSEEVKRTITLDEGETRFLLKVLMRTRMDAIEDSRRKMRRFDPESILASPDVEVTTRIMRKMSVARAERPTLRFYEDRGVTGRGDAEDPGGVICEHADICCRARLQHVVDAVGRNRG